MTQISWLALPLVGGLTAFGNAGRGKEMGKAQMPTIRGDIESRIAALKGRAVAALHDHHPEIAAPLLEQALELHRALRRGLNPPDQLTEMASLNLDMLDAGDIEVLLDEADRTAFESDEFDSLCVVPKAHIPLRLAATLYSPPPLNDQVSVEPREPAGPIESATNDLSADVSTDDDHGSNDEISDAAFDAWSATESEFAELEIIDQEPDDAPLFNELDELEPGLPEPEEFDEAPTREDVGAVRTVSKLTREERAFQEALHIGTHYGWDYDGICLLTEVFTLHWWSSAKKAMTRELDAGMTAGELRLALAARRIWVSNPEFHENHGLGRFSHPHPSLPWPTALAIARYYTFEPDPDEISTVLWGLHDGWQCSASLAERFPSFYEFVRMQFGLDSQCLIEEPGWSFVPDADRRPIEDDIESLLPAEWSFGWGCYRTPPAPMLD